MRSLLQRAQSGRWHLRLPRESKSRRSRRAWNLASRAKGVSCFEGTPHSKKRRKGFLKKARALRLVPVQVELLGLLVQMFGHMLRILQGPLFPLSESGRELGSSEPFQ